MREAGYPVHYFGWLFDSYVRSFMIFASLPKDYDFASFDVVYTKGKTRLLHYHSLNSSNESDKPLLLIYAPINKFHIMDISKDRSVPLSELMFLIPSKSLMFIAAILPERGMKMS